ncbi:MAG: alanine--glyoxylate aminotransferase family protein [Bacillota bacterium]
MREPLLMTPGPTGVDERVRQAAARPMTVPELDPEFPGFYRRLTGRVQELMETKADCLILDGEAIMGLEAAVAALVEPGDKVLVLANGVFGHGFADFVEMYQGIPVKLVKDYRHPFAADDLKKVLDQEPELKVCVLVHCETPSGLLNPIGELLPVLKEAGLLTIVDAVSSLGAHPVKCDQWGIDICLGGSQKCLSAPPGLTLLCISTAAWQAMAGRRAPIPGYYLNLSLWRRTYLEKGEFPYTPPVSSLHGLEAALELLFEEGLEIAIDRQRVLGEAVRATLREAGLEVYPVPGAEANSVTAVEIPRGIDDRAFRHRLWEEKRVMIAGSYGPLAGRVWRLGHMGYNAEPSRIFRTFLAMDTCLKEMGWKGKPLAPIWAGKMGGR